MVTVTGVGLFHHVVGLGTGWTTEELWFDYGQGQKRFLFAIA